MTKNQINFKLYTMFNINKGHLAEFIKIWVQHHVVII